MPLGRATLAPTPSLWKLSGGLGGHWAEYACDMHYLSPRFGAAALGIAASLALVLASPGCADDSSGSDSDTDASTDSEQESEQDSQANSQGGQGGPSTTPGDPSTTGARDTTGEPPMADDPLPDIEYCDAVTQWPNDIALAEAKVAALVNVRRSEGADCGAEGMFAPAGPLTHIGAPRCSSRKHSLDMAERGFFDHTNPDGESPFDRMARAEYSFSTAGENIAAGQMSANEVMEAWMDSDGHCSNIMNPSFTEIGVGYARAEGTEFVHYWTQNFGSP